MACLAPSPVWAQPRANDGIERELAADLIATLEVAQRVRTRLQQIADIRETETLLVALQRLRASALLLEGKQRAVQQRLADIGAPGTVLGRQAAMTTLVREQLDPVVQAAEQLRATVTAGDRAAALAAIERVVATLANVRQPGVDRTPLGLSLPYRPMAVPPAAPAAGSPITPAYLAATSPAPTAADLASGGDTTVTPAIAQQAQALGHNPIAIFDFVRTTVATEFYHGAMKGARQTLADRSGNAIDQASLLITLFRASSVPARYVRGVVRLTDADLRAWASVGSMRRAIEVLTKGGVPFLAVRQGGVIAALDVEHTWVEAYVPYANYRGAPLDAMGHAWVPLDPSFKAPAVAGQAPPSVAALTGDAVVGDYLAAVQPVSPVDFLRAKVVAVLGNSSDGPSVSDILFTRTLPSTGVGLLPSTLPYETIAVTGEYAELPESLRQTVRITAEGDEGVAFDVTVPVSTWLGRRLTISYVPATVEDQIVSDGFLGLDNTPAYLVRVRPVLKVGGAVHAAGETSVAMGALHRVTIELRTPRQVVPIANSLVAGGYYAIGLSAGATTDLSLEEALPEDTERFAAERLYRIAADYQAQWNAAEQAIGSLLHVVHVSPMVSEVMVGNVYNRTLLFGQPQSIEWRGVFVDADLRVTEAIPTGMDDNRGRDFLRLAGLAGSLLEGTILEQHLGVESVSAGRLLQLARADAVPVRSIDAANVAVELPLLQTAEIVKSEIAEAVRQDWRALVPQRDLTRHAWSGIGYLLVDPASGAAGYFISGGLAGGMTAIDPAEWVRQEYARELGHPYADEPNRDPNAAFSISKVVATDHQEDVAGEPVDRPLAVWVRDAEGKPVEGALVTFSILSGGGSFAGAAEIEAKTDGLGIALARPTLSQRTADAPFYVKTSPEDEHATQAGENLVQARVRAAGGEIALAAPFQLFGFPGPAVRILKVLGEGNIALIGTAGGTIRARVVDQHNNPISNRPVEFRVLPPTVDSGTLPATTRNLALFKRSDCPNPAPLIGECAAEAQISIQTTVFGADVETILGDTVETTYRVAAASPGVETQTFTLFSAGLRDYENPSYIGPTLHLTQMSLINDRGQLLNAAEVGREFKRPLGAVLALAEDHFTIEPTGNPDCVTTPPGAPCYRIVPTGTLRVRPVDVHKPGPPIEYSDVRGPIPPGDKAAESGSVSFTVTAGGGVTMPPVAAAPEHNPGSGRYVSRLVVGTAPALNTVEVDATAQVIVPYIDLYSGRVQTRQIAMRAGDRLVGFDSTGVTPIIVPDLLSDKLKHQVFGVRARVLEQENVLIGSSGGTTTDFDLEYRIEPSAYVAELTEVDLFSAAGAEETWIGLLPGNTTQGDGRGRIHQGTGGFDPRKDYRAQLVLNRGSEVEIRSEKQTLGAYLTAPFAVDFRSRENTAEHSRRRKSVDLKEALLAEKVVLRDMIAAGLAEGASCGVPAAALTLVEQGSGACFWRPGFETAPVAACAAFHPKVSDHDYEVLIPDEHAGRASCLVDALNKAGEKADLGEVSFFAVSKEEFVEAELNIDPPSGGGSDVTGDLGLGRQSLLLKWALEGEYVTGVAGLPAPAPSLGTVLTTLRSKQIIEGEPSGIPRLEGFEWATLQEYNFFKSRSHVRIGGRAVDPKSSLYELQQKEVHDAAKAGIRAAMGRLVADPRGNQLLFITRDQYQSAAGCLTGTENPSRPRAPAELFGKICDSFEEHIASSAVRSLRDGLGIFTAEDVALIYQFYRVKADAPCAAADCRTQLTTEAEAAAFAAQTLAFIRRVAAETRAIYEETLASGLDPRADQRRVNADTAARKANEASESATRTLEERVLNDNDLELGAIPLSLYSNVDGVPAPWMTYTVPRVRGRSETIVDIVRDADGNPIPDGESGRYQKVFAPTMPAAVPKFVAFVLDPSHTVRDCVPSDNFTGFFTYPLDLASPAPPTLPPFPPNPVEPPPVPPECTEKPVPSLTVTKLVNAQPHIKVVPDTPVTITHHVVNTGAVPLQGVTVTDLLTQKTHGPFALVPGESRPWTEVYRPRELGKELIGPSEVIGFTASGVTATAWDSIGIDVVSPPCPVAIAPLDPDPNAYAENGLPLSTVMEGGSIFRYYRVVGVAGPGTVVFGVNGRAVTAEFDAEGYILHSRREGEDEVPATELRGLEVRAVDMGAPGSYEVKFLSVNGSTSVCSQPFFIEVKPREFSRAYNAGAAIEASATAAVGLAGKAGVGFGISIDESVDGPRRKLSVDRSINGALGAQIGIASPKVSGSLGVRGGFGGSLKGSFLGTLMFGDSHEFEYVPGGTDLPPPAARAFGGLLLGTLAFTQYNNPLLFAVLNAAAETTDYHTYQSGFSVAAGVEVSGEGEFEAATGLQSFNSAAGRTYNDISYGVGGAAGASVSRSVNFGVDLKFKDAELVPGFSSKFAADIGGSIGIGSLSEELDEKTKQKVLDLKDKLKASFKGVFSESWKVKLALDAARDYRPKKLTISFATEKGFGWKVAGKAYVSGAVSGDPEKVTYTYSIENADVIQQAIDHLTSIKELARLVAGAGLSTTGVVLGPLLLDEELRHLLEILAKAETAWDVSGEKGNGISFPVKIDLGAGARFEAKAGIAFDRSVGYTKETGVVKNGQSYLRERYPDDGLIPGRLAPVTDLSDVAEIFQESIDGLVAAVGGVVDTVNATVVSGVNRIRSRNTAELTFDGATAPFTEVGIASFTYDPVFGPVAPKPQLPVDPSGPADVPHYGIGGYHQFLPNDAQLTAPGTLTVFYEDDEVTGVNEATLAIYAWNDTTSQWDFVGGTVDPAANTVTTSVRRLGLYTVAPPMPAGSFTLTSQTSRVGTTTEPRTAVQYTSAVIRMNTGQPVADGTLFTVATLAPQGTVLTPFGTMTTDDVDPLRDGVQVRSLGGVIRFSAEYPGAFGAARVLIYSTPGTALADHVIPYQ